MQQSLLSCLTRFSEILLTREMETNALNSSSICNAECVVTQEIQCAEWVGKCGKWYLMPRYMLQNIRTKGKEEERGI